MKLLTVAVALSTLLLSGRGDAQAPSADADDLSVSLPAPRLEGELSVEAALARRRSVRSYAASPLSLGEISQLLWSAQGVTDKRGRTAFRTAPSAGALYPLELYLVTANTGGLQAGVYRYGPRQHALRPLARGDRRGLLAAAALDQDCE